MSSKMERLIGQYGENIRESVNVVSDALAPGPTTSTAPSRWIGVAKSKDTASIPIDRIERDENQPREEFDDEALSRLAASIKSRGQLQPIRVRWDEAGGIYRIICGERRWRAAKMAGLTTIAAVITEGTISADDLLAIQMVENCVREDLRPIEQARAFKTLMDRNGWTVRRAADELSVNSTAIAKAIALLDLPAAAQADVDRGELSPTAAYEIAQVRDDDERSRLADRAVKEKLTVAEVKAERDGHPQARLKKLEYKDRNGCKLTMSVPEGLDHEDAITACQRAIKQWNKAARAREESAA